MARIQRYGSSRPTNLGCRAPVECLFSDRGAVTWGSSMYRLKIASSPCHSKSPTDGMIHAFRLNRAPCRNKAASLGSSHTQWLDRGDLAGTARCKDSADREGIKHYACRERVGSGLHAFS
ncbi:hypothetical protein NEUTE1DRAFT_39680 [Neurospora tetrasperma FGSC 2508]|uniref:Uncharacterized protein n=1 Tax=Neurospora tetrasperma (strain FGSC 2508 / ATCC MYA-4615 / P0657) TaxID=510951 RepID=F8MGB6_NEUT8|nr:uncharacterized protein NEUTE1DRAFT_39680 [Neurospora tetrasperma FGSC 2508]EGO58591.1 hypothetical protein NEUTE1DRAFT_39680 [Neurospora tetrasperma FGSC 2508]EGZ72664.1 hypothetical protein NEUTE2DRAFT_127044 [Neurospora tetrasperma FGSC 2509]